MRDINIYALDNQLNMIAILKPTNIQWSRKYYENGYFSILLPLEQYSKEIAYIYTPDRPETGRVTQINYISENHSFYVSISGWFLERDLNDFTVNPNKTTLTELSGNAEWVASEYVRLFSEGIDNIITGERGKLSIDTFNGEFLDNKVHNILKPSEMSYRVSFDFLTNKKTWSAFQGVDRTHSQTQNNFVIFSTKYGNIKNPNIVISEDMYKNSALIKFNPSAGEDYKFFEHTPNPIVFPDRKRQVMIDCRDTFRNDYPNEEEFMRALRAEAEQELTNNYSRIINTEFDALNGSYEYMEDFDLGDKCDVEIPEIGFSEEVRLTGVYEVVKFGQISISLEFGDQTLLKW